MSDDIDDLLRKLGSEKASTPADLQRRVIQRIQPREDLFNWLTGSIWRPVYTVFLPLLVGLVLGLTDMQEASDYQADALLYAAYLDEATSADYFEENEYE